jgi:hypothetical protein
MRYTGLRSNELKSSGQEIGYTNILFKQNSIGIMVQRHGHLTYCSNQTDTWSALAVLYTDWIIHNDSMGAKRTTRLTHQRLMIGRKHVIESSMRPAYFKASSPTTHLSVGCNSSGVPTFTTCD